jgi:PAS domain S-box-containing protein
MAKEANRLSVTLQQIPGKIAIQEGAIPFEAILDTMSEMIVYHDDALNVLWANGAAAEFVGLRPEEMVGKQFFDVACRKEEPCPGCPVVKGPSSEYLEFIENSLLTGRLYFTRSYPLSGFAGRLIVAQDISDMRNKYSVTEALNLISEVFHSSRGILEICEQLIGMIASRFDYPAGVITSYDEQTQEIVNLGEYGFSERLLPAGKRFPLSKCFSQGVLKSGHTVNLTGLSKIEDFNGYVLKEAGAETILAVPLEVDGKIIGTIVLIDLKERLEKNLMIDGLKAVANRLGAEIHRKQTEEKLREERNFTNAILNNAGPLILVLNQKGQVARFNKACERLTGYSYEEVSGKFIWDILVDSKDSHLIRGMFPLSDKRTPPPSFESYWITRNREKRLISWSTSIMGKANENGIHIVSIGMDITDKRQAEEEAGLRKRQLLEADKMASLGVLASGVAHEINNPNNFIMMNTPILREAWTDISPILDKYYNECAEFTVANMPYSEMREEVPRLFEGIEAGAERIRRIILNMKHYARRDDQASPQKVDLNDIITTAVGLLSYEIKKSTRLFTIERQENLPPVKGNPQRLEQVLVNLIQNACQALPDRGKGIVILSFYKEEKGEVMICVADEGIGIHPEHLKHIFDPFFTTKGARGGTGLGLSVCLGIVKEHKGRLKFFSELGIGTKAYLSLPAAV